MIDEELLTKIRHERGLYSIEELSIMFCCGRKSIDFALNTGQLKYMSPNNRTRFVYLDDFEKYMNGK